MGELDHAVVVLIAIADEGQGELARRVILAAQQLHAEMARVEIDRLIHVHDADHRVQQTVGHSSSLYVAMAA